MKKLLIATAIAASLTTGAHALTTYTVDSTINSVKLFVPQGMSGLPDIDLQATTGASANGLSISGYAYDYNSDGVIDDSQLSFVGRLQFDPGTVPIRVTFNLSAGTYVPGVGVTFTAGTVQVDAFTTTSGWVPYSTIDVASTNIPFVAGTATGHIGTNDTAGLQLNPAGVTLPGTGYAGGGGAGEDDAVSGLTLLGKPAGLFLDGSLVFTTPGYP